MLIEWIQIEANKNQKKYFRKYGIIELYFLEREGMKNYNLWSSNVKNNFLFNNFEYLRSYLLQIKFTIKIYKCYDEKSNSPDLSLSVSSDKQFRSGHTLKL